MDFIEKLRFWHDYNRLDCGHYMRGADVPLNVASAMVAREKSSHRGVKERTELRELGAYSVNQAFLDEIGHLHALEYLEIPKFFTAKDLSPLLNLQNLRILKFNSPRNILDFTPIVKLQKLERLYITNAWKMRDIEWLRPLKGQLKVFSFDGDMYRNAYIESLCPLEEFELDALLLGNSKLGDKSLADLRSMHSLKFLQASSSIPRLEYEALYKAQPRLECGWFHDEAWEDLKQA